MPTNEIQWAWFFFWGLGALGGIAFLLYLVMNAVDIFINWMERQ